MFQRLTVQVGFPCAGMLLLSCGIVAFTQDKAKPQTKINSIDGAEMVWIPGGTFQMGSDKGQKDEKPVHEQTVAGFWMYRHDVTVAQFRKFCEATKRKMPAAPAWGHMDNHPIVNVAWDQANAYCAWARVRLPTEAEWEYAARGGKGFEYGTSTGQIDDKLASFGGKNKGTKPVGSYPPNPFGLYDMAGNACQWCSSLRQPYPYRSDDGRENPKASGSRVVRGGCMLGSSDQARCAYRDNDLRGEANPCLGFRCAMTP